MDSTWLRGLFLVAWQIGGTEEYKICRATEGRITKPVSAGASGPVRPCSPPGEVGPGLAPAGLGSQEGISGKPHGPLGKWLVSSISMHYLLGYRKGQVGPSSLEAQVQLQETNSSPD